MTFSQTLRRAFAMLAGSLLLASAAHADAPQVKTQALRRETA
jgi:hypothetical protein